MDWGTVFYCKYVLDDKGKHFQVEWNRVARIIGEMKGEPRWKSGAFNQEKGDLSQLCARICLQTRRKMPKSLAGFYGENGRRVEREVAVS